MAQAFELQLPEGFPAHLFPQGKGIEVAKSLVRFDGPGFTDASIRQIAKSIFERTTENGHFCTFRVANVKQVLDSELEMLETATGYSLKGKSVFRSNSANTILDRQNDRFSKTLLQRFAKIANGKERPALLWSHSMSIPIGKVIEGKVMEMQDQGGNSVLEETFYVDDQAVIPTQNMKIADQIRSRTLEFVSIGFMAKSMIEETQAGFIRVFHGNDETPVEHPETSIVSYPAQRGASVKFLQAVDPSEIIIKSLLPKGKRMNIEKSIPLNLNGTNYNFNVKASGEDSAPVITVEAPAELSTALKSVSEVETLRKEVDSFKKPIIEKIIALQTQLEKAAKSDETELKAIGIEKLTAIKSDLEKEFTAKNPTGQGTGKKTETTEKSTTPRSVGQF